MDRYYVLGFDDRGFLFPMSNEGFEYRLWAEDVRDRCPQHYKPFVVEYDPFYDEPEDDDE